MKILKLEKYIPVKPPAPTPPQPINHYVKYYMRLPGTTEWKLMSLYNICYMRNFGQKYMVVDSFGRIL